MNRNENLTTLIDKAIATNHLINYKKHMFAQYPLSFEFYENDIENAPVKDIPDLTQDVEKSILAEFLESTTPPCQP